MLVFLMDGRIILASTGLFSWWRHNDKSRFSIQVTPVVGWREEGNRLPLRLCSDPKSTLPESMILLQSDFVANR